MSNGMAFTFGTMFGATMVGIFLALLRKPAFNRTTAWSVAKWWAASNEAASKARDEYRRQNRALDMAVVLDRQEVA